MRTFRFFRLFISIVLGLIACRVPACRQKTEFDFTAYNSSEEVRAALLEQVPVGSGVDDVYNFFSKNNIPDALALNQRHGHGHFDDEDNTIKLVMKADIWGAEWFIDFRFDKNKHLEDIEVRFFRTLP